MLDRKHIRAPSFFDPGKGHPRERLIYANDAEMEMLRVLTDGTISRGPRGIPSFAVTSGKTTGTTMGGNPTSSNPSGGGPGGPFGPNSGPSKATSSQPSGPASGVGGGNKGASQNSSPKSPSGPSGPNSGSSTGKPAGGSSASGASTPSAPSRSPSSPSVGPATSPSSPMGGQGSSFGSSAAAASYNRGVSARNQTTPTSPMGGQQSSFSRPSAAADANRRTASAIKGGSNPSGSSKTASAIAGSNVNRYPGQGTTPLTGAPRGPFGPDRMAPNVGTDFNQTLRREAQDIGIDNPYVDNSLENFNDWATKSFGRFAGVPRDVAETMTRTVVGEAAGESLLGQAAVAKVMENRLKYGDEYGRYDFGSYENPNRMLGAFDANGLQRARTGGQNEGYRNATTDSPQYARASAAMADSLDPYGDLATQRPEVLNATHYVTRTAEPDTYWTRNNDWQSTRTQLGNHVFGNPERTASRVDALNQQSMPAAAARTQAYNAANPPAQRGMLQPASYDGGILDNVNGSYRAQAPADPGYQLSEGGIYNGLRSIPGAISGLGQGIRSISQGISTPNPAFKGMAGMLTSSNPIVRAGAQAVAGQVIGPQVKEFARSTIQGIKDIADPNNPRAQEAERERKASAGGPRTNTAGAVRDSQSAEQRDGPKRASATKSGSKGNPDRGKGGDRENDEKETVAQKAARIGKKKIEDLAKPEPKAVDWSNYTNVMTKEQAMRKLLGEEWYA